MLADHRILIKEGEIVWERKKHAFERKAGEETVHFFLFNDVVIFAKHATTMKQVLTKFSFQKSKYKMIKWFPLYKTKLVATPGSSSMPSPLPVVDNSNHRIASCSRAQSVRIDMR